ESDQLADTHVSLGATARMSSMTTAFFCAHDTTENGHVTEPRTNDEMLTGKHLKLRGWPEGKIIGLAKATGEALEAQGLHRETILDRLDAVRARPDDYLTDAHYGPLAKECARRAALSQERLD